MWWSNLVLNRLSIEFGGLVLDSTVGVESHGWRVVRFQLAIPLGECEQHISLRSSNIHKGRLGGTISSTEALQSQYCLALRTFVYEDLVHVICTAHGSFLTPVHLWDFGLYFVLGSTPNEYFVILKVLSHTELLTVLLLSVSKVIRTQIGPVTWILGGPPQDI